MKRILSIMLVFVLCLSVLVSCGEPKVNAGLESAKENLDVLYKSKLGETPADYELVAQVMIDGVVYPVEWSVNVTAGVVVIKEEGKYVVDVDNKAVADIPYTLTAKITDTASGETATVSYDCKVPMFQVGGYDEYYAAEKDAAVTVRGVVVGMVAKSVDASYNCVFVQDATKGGYYVYGMSQDPIVDLGLKVGMTVLVTGTKDIYNGTHEIKDPSFEILNDGALTDVVPFDITEAYKAAADLKDLSITGIQGALVTIKGVEITGQDASNGYYKFKLGELESYVRISSSTCAISKADQATFKAGHTEHFGWTANVTGIVSVYSGAFYLVPVSVDAYEYLSAVEKTPAEKVEIEAGNLKVNSPITSDGVVNLPVVGTNYADVVITWASNSEHAVVGENGALTVTIPDEAVEVTLTATITCGEASTTKEIKVELSKSLTPITDALEIGAAQESYTDGKYLVAGIVTEVYNTTYGNLYITDANGNVLTVYGTYSADGANRYDAMEGAPQAGDYIVVLGVLGQYKGTPQMKNGWIQSVTHPTSVEDALEIGAAQESYTEEKHLVTGEITEIYNTTYGNMKIKDANGNILTVYGTYSEDGKVRFDGLENPPKVGDTIVVLGVLGQYKGAPQMKNGWIVLVAAGESGEGGEGGEGGETPAPDADPTPDSTLTVEQALALGASKEHDSYTAGKYYVTGEIVEVYNTTYGNMKIKDAAGNILTVYGTYSADGSARYDAMEVKPVAGDTVTVYGIIGQYNDTPQMKNGWITAHTPAGGSTTPDPTPDPDPVPDPEPSQVTIADALAAADGTEVVVVGIVSQAGAWNEEHSNMNVTITDGTNSLYIYRLGTKVAVGDAIKVTGTMATYNDARQIGQGATAEIISSGNPVPGKDANAVTLSFGDVSNRTSLTTEQQVWQANGITVTNDKASSNNNVADYADPARFYQGSTLTIACNGMTKVTFNVNTGKPLANLTGALDAAEIAYTVSGNAVTIEFASATNSITINLSVGQVRLDSIDVVVG